MIKKKVVTILLLGLLILLSTISFAHLEMFRAFYIHFFYPAISNLLRFLLGWIPFSLGDVIYLLMVFMLIFSLYALVKALFRLKKRRRTIVIGLLNFVIISLTIVSIFLFFWGFNYRVDRIEAEFGITETANDSEALKKFCGDLIKDLNQNHRYLAGDDTSALNDEYYSFEEIRKEAIKSYEEINPSFDFLRLSSWSVKPSLFGQWMNYAGITGYYNPLTGEAQVNTTVPAFDLPFTTCHEIAHQIGYAAEQDANFIAYLVTSNSSNPFFRYSGDFSLMLYSMAALRKTDKVLADSLWNQVLHEGVRRDYRFYRDFYQQYENKAEPIITSAYDQYLKANKQAKGVQSYRGVVGLVLNYREKYEREDRL